jgi:hypothetical protein
MRLTRDIVISYENALTVIDLRESLAKSVMPRIILEVTIPSIIGRSAMFRHELQEVLPRKKATLKANMRAANQTTLDSAWKVKISDR